jgi:hypothetical protein
MAPQKILQHSLSGKTLADVSASQANRGLEFDPKGISGEGYFVP